MPYSGLNNKLVDARRLLAVGKFREAEILYLELLDVTPDDELIGELTNLYIKSRQFEKAVGCIERLISLNPEKVELYLDLARLSENAGFLEKSVASYSQLLAKKPDLPNCLFNMAILLKKLGRLAEAAAAYEDALRRGISKKHEVYNNLAVVYSELNEPQRAVECFKRALAINPNYIPALFNHAGLEEERGHKDKAKSLYRQVLAAQADYYPALSRLAYIDEVVNPDDPIIGQLKAALQKSSIPPLEREELWFALGKSLDDCGDYEAAFQAYYSANQIGRARFRKYRKDLQEKLVTDLMETFDSNWFSTVFEGGDFSPIFICGMLRSGSTLLEKVLSGHTHITAGGELEYFPRLVQRLGDRYPRSVKREGIEFFESAAQGYERFVRERLGSPDYFTDKRPDNFLHIGLIKSLFPKAKVIWTKRGLLDNCLSIYFQQLGAGMSYSVDLDSIGHYYQQHIRLMEYWRSLFPSSVHEINYEGFVSSPRRELERLLRFIGLDWEDSCLDFTGGESSVKTASIWQVRKSLYRKSSGRYKNYEKHLQPLKKYL